jgi:MFS family permease
MHLPIYPSYALSNHLRAFSFNMSSLLMAPPYLFTTEKVGLMQIAAIIGFLIACLAGGKLSDVINAFIVRQSSGHNIWPEQRLIALIPGMLLGPVGCVLLAFACGKHLHWALIAAGFGLVSFGSVYTPNIAITYLVHRHQREAAECLVLINIFKNLVAFLFLYEAVSWANRNGFIQVYMIMFMLNVLVLIFALPLYYWDAKKRRMSEEV